MSIFASRKATIGAAAAAITLPGLLALLISRIGGMLQPAPPPTTYCSFHPENSAPFSFGHKISGVEGSGSVTICSPPQTVQPAPPDQETNSTSLNLNLPVNPVLSETLEQEAVLQSITPQEIASPELLKLQPTISPNLIPLETAFPSTSTTSEFPTGTGSSFSMNIGTGDELSLLLRENSTIQEVMNLYVSQSNTNSQTFNPINLWIFLEVINTQNISYGTPTPGSDPTAVSESSVVVGLSVLLMGIGLSRLMAV
ncbi:MAG: hypothetical protein HC881_16025 [Leptolyngbyaceae cyanobacterium SL_7_1]|nr:hypothetical protein [Leptolyngbyaceae cyanobacterium SL_7_1]